LSGLTPSAGRRDRFGSDIPNPALVQILNSGKLWAFCGEDETVKNIPSLEELFKGRHFERDLIVLCVRWYLRYKL
jgi:hypothetical protein